MSTNGDTLVALKPSLFENNPAFMLNPRPVDSHRDSSALTDELLLANWVDDHSDALFRFARQRVDDPHSVEDVLQETFLAAIRAKDSFRGDASVRTWLIAILRLKIIDYYRRQKVEAKKLGRDIESGASIRTEAVHCWSTSPTDTIDQEEFWQVLKTCMSKLPETLSRAFLLREVDRCSPDEIAAVLGISQQNLAVRLFRARASLRQCLDQNWFSKD